MVHYFDDEQMKRAEKLFVGRAAMKAVTFKDFAVVQFYDGGIQHSAEITIDQLNQILHGESKAEVECSLPG